MVDVEGEKRKAATPFFIRVRIDSWEYFQSRASVINIIGHGPQRKTTPLVVVVHSLCAQKSLLSCQPKPATPSVPSMQSAKKRAGLKSKAKARSGTEGTQGDVLGGADYVTLLLGGSDEATDPDVMDRLCIPWPGPGS